MQSASVSIVMRHAFLRFSALLRMRLYQLMRMSR